VKVAAPRKRTRSSAENGVILALAGRRVDPTDPSPSRFPSHNIARVKEELHQLLRRLHPKAIVCSAAAGADLLALEVAGDLNIRRLIVLPFAAERFRRTSVTDRPGPWGPLFDKILSTVADRGDLLVLSGTNDDDESYAVATDRLLEEAEQLSGQAGNRMTCAAAVVWDGAPRPGHDLTAQFDRSARARGWPVYEVKTL
jgi:hypothetical protein